jgi:hypothetical protein
MSNLDSVRDETYTGDNRCWPCTLVNIAIVGIVAVALALRKRRLLGALVATVGLGVVYLRGYLVPYTPRFAPELVAASPLPDEWFHDDYSPPDIDDVDSQTTAAEFDTGSEATGADESDETGRSHDTDESVSLSDDVDLDGEAVMRELAEAGVIDADDEMLFLTDDVETAWYDTIDELATLPLDALAAEVHETFPHVQQAEGLHTDDRDWVVVGAGGGNLIARPVAVAEVAAYRVLADYVDDDQVRTAATETFRMFLEECPVCGTELAESTETGCCGGHTNPREAPDETLVCPSCEQRVYRFPTE